MSLMDKVKFWKGDDLDFDAELPPLEMDHNNLGVDPSSDPLGQGLQPKPLTMDDFREEQPRPGSGFQQPMQHPQSNNKDFELLSSKLDAIKAQLDSISQRLITLERVSQPEPKKEKAFYTKDDPWQYSR